MHEFFILLSLFISIPTIFFSVAVIIMWRKEALNFLKNNHDSTSWLILGIWISFLGFTLDNIYWDLAWTYEYLYPKENNNLFIYGSVSTAFFREILGLFAGYCHIKAYFMERKAKNFEIPILFTLGTVAGLAYVACLFLGKV